MSVIDDMKIIFGSDAYLKSRAEYSAKIDSAIAEQGKIKNVSEIEEITITDVSDKRLGIEDPGKHYRYEYTVKLKLEDINRGSITIKIDPYFIARLYKMIDHMDFFILKKVLRLGRAHKDRAQEMKDIINAAERRLETIAEDANNG